MECFVICFLMSACGLWLLCLSCQIAQVYGVLFILFLGYNLEAYGIYCVYAKLFWQQVLRRILIVEGL